MMIYSPLRALMAYMNKAQPTEAYTVIVTLKSGYRAEIASYAVKTDSELVPGETIPGRRAIFIRQEEIAAAELAEY